MTNELPGGIIEYPSAYRHSLSFQVNNEIENATGQWGKSCICSPPVISSALKCIRSGCFILDCLAYIAAGQLCLVAKVLAATAGLLCILKREFVAKRNLPSHHIL
jgi:hypothetical protein